MATKTQTKSGNPAKRAAAQHSGSSSARPAPVNPSRLQLARARVFGKADWRPWWAIALSIFVTLGLVLAITVSIQLLTAAAGASGNQAKIWLMVGNLVIISSGVSMANLASFWFRGGRRGFWLGFISALFIIAWCYEARLFPI